MGFSESGTPRIENAPQEASGGCEAQTARTITGALRNQAALPSVILLESYSERIRSTSAGQKNYIMQS